MQTYTKQFLSATETQEEWAGYQFAANYFTAIPQLITADTGKAAITYTAVTHTAQPLSDALYSGLSVDMRSSFSHLSSIASRHLTYRQSQGGTVKFFLERQSRLMALQSTYQFWAARNSSSSLNNTAVTIDPLLLKKILTAVDGFTVGLCAPSQGDLHERNIFTNGYVIDFEAAGWNLVATDIATFLWHTLFAGNYFGPLYAKWATPSDQTLIDTPRPISIAEDGSVRFTLSAERRDLAKQFMDYYVTPLSLDDKVRQDICAAISMRFLTTFTVQAMSADDRHATFVLANYFMATPLYDILRELLD